MAFVLPYVGSMIASGASYAMATPVFVKALMAGGAIFMGGKGVESAGKGGEHALSGTSKLVKAMGDVWDPESAQKILQEEGKNHTKLLQIVMQKVRSKELDLLLAGAHHDNIVLYAKIAAAVLGLIAAGFGTGMIQRAWRAAVNQVKKISIFGFSSSAPVPSTIAKPLSVKKKKMKRSSRRHPLRKDTIKKKYYNRDGKEIVGEDEDEDEDEDEGDDTSSSYSSLSSSSSKDGNGNHHSSSSSTSENAEVRRLEQMLNDAKRRNHHYHNNHNHSHNSSNNSRSRKPRLPDPIAPAYPVSTSIPFMQNGRRPVQINELTGSNISSRYGGGGGGNIPPSIQQTLIQHSALIQELTQRIAAHEDYLQRTGQAMGNADQNGYQYYFDQDRI